MHADRVSRELKIIEASSSATWHLTVVTDLDAVTCALDPQPSLITPATVWNLSDGEARRSLIDHVELLKVLTGEA